MSLKIGDVIHSCWGYSMVLHDFYEIVGTTPKTVKVRALKKIDVGGTLDSLEVKPLLGHYDDRMNIYDKSPILQRKIHTTKKLGNWDTSPAKQYITLRSENQIAYLDDIYNPNEKYCENHMD